MSPGGNFYEDVIESHITSGDSDDLATSNAELRSSPFKKTVSCLSGNLEMASTNDVHELLECPVCMNLMYPPIYQVISHIFHYSQTY